MICHSDMRQADINRAKKARLHLEAANTILSNIKLEKTNSNEDYFIKECRGPIGSACLYLDDLFSIQK